MQTRRIRRAPECPYVCQIVYCLKHVRPAVKRVQYRDNKTKRCETQFIVCLFRYCENV